MVVRDVHIESYSWKVRIYYAVTCYHSNKILNDLIDINCPENILERVGNNLYKSDMNTGFTYSNKDLGSTVMVIGLFSSPAQFLNSLQHEIRHLVDDITTTYNIATSGEEVAYLTGDINELIIEDVQRFICNCKCHKKKY